VVVVGEELETTVDTADGASETVDEVSGIVDGVSEIVDEISGSVYEAVCETIEMIVVGLVVVDGDDVIVAYGDLVDIGPKVAKQLYDCDKLRLTIK